MSKERPEPAAPRPAVPEPKRPYHLGVAIGVTTGAYALSLMAASTLQIQHDRALIADRHPVEVAVSVLGSNHDAMESRLELARSRYADGADGYGVLIARLDKMRARLEKMDRTVAAIERDSGSIAARIPGVPVAGSRQARASTGRSGGGGSSGGGSTAPRTVPGAPAAAAPPPVSAGTGASGAP